MSLRSFGEMFEEMAQSMPKLSAVGQIARLRETFAQYSRDCPFSPGNLVTPRHGTDLIGAGEPNIVLQTRVTSQPDFFGESGSNRFGQFLNMRVASCQGDKVTSHWVEAWQFEAYNEGGDL